MARFRTRGAWTRLSANDGIDWQGRSRSSITVRCDKELAVYGADNEAFTDELLLASGPPGEMEIEVFGYNDLFVRFDTVGRVWLKDGAADQLVIKLSEEAFVNLDKPAALSPEMEAIMRMQRKNQLERDEFMQFARAQMETIEELRNDVHTRREASASAPSGSNSEDVEDEEGRVQRRGDKRGAGRGKKTLAENDVDSGVSQQAGSPARRSADKGEGNKPDAGKKDPAGRAGD